MDKLLTMSALRRVIQLTAFVFFVYGATIFTTFYTGDKLTQNLPALSCAYDMKGGDFCTLIPLQHQMDHRVSGLFTQNAKLMEALLPTLITIGTVAALILVLNKAFCGWLCPLGFFQEVITMIGTKLGLTQITALGRETVLKIRPIKWFIFLFLVLIFPILTGIGLLGHEWGAPFCAICPSRIMTTLATGDMAQVYVSEAGWGYFALSLIADLLFGLMVALALFVRQPFCRICPILPMQTLFKKIGLLRLVKNGSSHCDGCGHCVKACPMDIYEIQEVAANHDITHSDCTLCGRCIEFCPQDGVMNFKYGPLTLHSSSKQGFKKRLKIDKWWKG
ncbi:MAG: 4Fe-4S binding protein [Sulfuricurvum sp.]|uniref:4Fe-4S binding protein n=1 Tax=Sulfuricurvum sp. TaxID=2025608 RepID=UPI0025E036C3|nr:4Fe-4S binding protein [Sulfuricurvum sp.]MCK9373941.1 4Fe-4S binding protein [Sulfuricurvum sp.]